MSNHTFIIKYDPIDRTVEFSIRSNDENGVDVADGAEIKYYENHPGLFTLEGQGEMVLSYLTENYPSESEFAIVVEVDQAGFDKHNLEFERFKSRIKKHNKDSDMKLLPEIKVSQSVSEPENTMPSKIGIAVVGKKGAGKTELIKGMGQHLLKDVYESSTHADGIIKYTNEQSDIDWYEIDGIDFEKDSLKRVDDLLSRLIKDSGIATVLYCLSCRTGKIEDMERDFVVKLKHENQGVKIFAVVTESIDADRALEFAEKISRTTTRIKTFPVLATEMRTKAGYLEPFGLDELVKELR